MVQRLLLAMTLSCTPWSIASLSILQSQELPATQVVDLFSRQCISSRWSSLQYMSLLFIGMLVVISVRGFLTNLMKELKVNYPDFALVLEGNDDGLPQFSTIQCNLEVGSYIQDRAAEILQEMQTLSAFSFSPKIFFVQLMSNLFLII
ncbi:GPCR-type G protein COLD1 isoform X2 [Iris pallida]|uniref:GPCR-type G protein COLD1 isoform X2 n=1 Tax=Iris pallida TaxID=29817 RepID=A0AAX6FZW9_IRIPA|nr:GPCR-type G protein COLD1 isoform X2 [Iris pallida]